jgi:hypothetical protein
MPVRAAVRNALPPEVAYRATVPAALVRDLLSVGLMLEYRDSARSRLERLLGPDAAASLVRRTLASNIG